MLREELFHVVVSYGRDSGHGTDETFEAIDRILAIVSDAVDSERAGIARSSLLDNGYHLAIGRVLTLFERSE